ncbi:hypothetical protein NLJ89_g5126 [Agrocybe chaxingu]|uniref:Zinc finger Mcm10/DnaG-type domain-containing protein n=1 Tax=Agrocybe chaxingu TaxID=84603 RepID=A0A9W8MVA9_9AGAR|nr:hypothetical protein NLJ89_g5126 [Agrocybe chaxingu]
MDSSSSRQTATKLKQEELKRQIALLQAQLEPESPVKATTPKSPKRKTCQPQTLAPATPSPRKKRKLDIQPSDKHVPRPVFQPSNSTQSISGQGKPPREQFTKPRPSNLLSNLTSIHQKSEVVDESEAVQRSTAFTDKPQDVPRRDERLAIVENLEMGPYEHTPSSDDPNFEKLEPHSGIHLSSRNIPHEDFKDYLRGRYYLSPSRLYSTVQLLPDKKGYDVPVEGDWITIAVIAERGPIKFTRAPVTLDPDESSKKQWKGKDKAQAEPKKPSGGKKFVNLKLIDFGARTGSSGSTDGKSVIRGDAFLTLLLFESDGFDILPREDGRKPEKLYKGGSRGAFEHLMDVREGDVVALLNPKILKPFQRSTDTPHPVDNVLAITPESASSIMVIGRARDLGMCSVRRQDGKICGSWCDKRVSDVCDYHVQNAVQRRRAARPEFSAGTSGLTTSTHKRKNDYDPARQWGLKPDESRAEGATYVVSGHVVTGTSSDPRTMYMTENIGREGQAKAKRKLESRDADRSLKALLQRDKEGMQAVMAAREVGGCAKSFKNEKKGKHRQVGDDEDTKLRQTAYSAEIIKSLGFDPSLKPGQRRVENKITQEKLVALETVRTARKDIILGPRPGPRIRSGVVAPVKTVELQEDVHEVNLDDYDDLVGDNTIVQEEKMVDLDDF